MAYLEEKTRLLTEQVAELEATIAHREAYIADLETERAELEASLADYTTALESSPAASPCDKAEKESSTSALWATLKRTVGQD